MPLDGVGADGFGTKTELFRILLESLGKPFSAEMFSAEMFSAEMFSAEMFAAPVLATTVAEYCTDTRPFVSTHAPTDARR